MMESTAALKHVMLTQDSLKSKEYMGVTVMPDGSKLMFYATDGNSLSWASMPLPEDYNAPRITLTPEFCSRLLGISGGDCVLELFPDSVIANFEGNTRIFGRLIGEETERDFAGRIAAAVPVTEPCPVPDLFKEALDRVIIISGSAVAKVLATGNGKDLSLTCKGEHGELAEQFTLGNHVQKFSTQLDARLVARALSGGPSRFIIGPRACWIAAVDTGFGNVSGAVH
jgi:DNA polymerase III sliding clamp (beta) subunit (PCNA family)